MKVIKGAVVAIGLLTPLAVHSEPIANGQGWTGFYAGGHLGVAATNFDGVFDSADSLDRLDDLSAIGFHGITGGAQLGYDHQINDYVVGFVVDGTMISGAGSTENATNDGIFELGYNWIASARGRIGFPANKVMPYITAGAAFAELDANHEFTLFDLPDANGSKTISGNGYVLGFGVDWAVKEKITIGGEILTYNWNISDDLTGMGVDRDSGDYLDVEGITQVRVTVNYRF